MTRAGSASPPESGIITTLRNAADFERVFRSGERVRRGPLVVVRAPGLEDRARYGLVVGRRVGNAVERNRVKRRLRHAIASSCQPDGTDIVVIASRGALNASFDDLVRWLGAGSQRRQTIRTQETTGG